MADPRYVELHGITPSQDLFTSPQREDVHGSVVDVDEAEKVFKDLDVSVREDTKRVADVEKGGVSDWNIHEFFEESVRTGEETGHKLKRMGVIVKGLTVVGMGADAASIPDNLDILKALWPPSWYDLLSSILYPLLTPLLSSFNLE